MAKQQTTLPQKLLELIWQNRLFVDQDLKLTDGTQIRVANPGIAIEALRNGEPVAEFCNATIQFPRKDITYCGNIKIDSLSSHWRAQGTITHPNLNSVMLHVVHKCDTTLLRHDRAVPTLELTVEEPLAELYYQTIAKAPSGADCTNYFAKMEGLYQGQILSRLMSDRINRKSLEVSDITRTVGGSWHQTCYIQILKSFGYKGQKEALEKLARALPYQYIVQAAGDVTKIEAYLLGMSGYLEIYNPDQYTRTLQNHWHEFRKRNDLLPPPIQWTIQGAVRPNSMPVGLLVRIAALLGNSESLLDEILRATDIYQIIALLDVKISKYWHTHTVPSSREASSIVTYGMTTDKINLVIINGIIPLLDAYGKYTSNPELRERAIDLYENIRAEENTYTRYWSRAGVVSKNAFESQAIIQLHTTYCLEKRCASCPIFGAMLHDCFKKYQSPGQ